MVQVGGLVAPLRQISDPPVTVTSVQGPQLSFGFDSLLMTPELPEELLSAQTRTEYIFTSLKESDFVVTASLPLSRTDIGFVG